MPIRRQDHVTLFRKKEQGQRLSEQMHMRDQYTDFKAGMTCIPRITAHYTERLKARRQ